MSIVIEGIDKPKCCYQCWLICDHTETSTSMDDPDFTCPFHEFFLNEEGFDMFHQVHKDCKIKEVTKIWKMYKEVE